MAVADVESVEGSVVTTIPVGVAGASLWDSTTLTVTATDPDGLSFTQEALVRVAPVDYGAWDALAITDAGGLLLRGNNSPITGCVAGEVTTWPADTAETDPGDTVRALRRSENVIEVTRGDTSLPPGLGAAPEPGPGHARGAPLRSRAAVPGRPVLSVRTREAGAIRW